MNENRIESVAQMDDLMPLINERLAAGQSVRFSPRGISMRPMLRQEKDSVILSPVTGRLKKYDLPLYQRSSGKYILHRIIDVADTYTCMGDNQFTAEPGIRHEQFIGVVTAYNRGEPLRSVDAPLYWLYCRVWHHSHPMRRFVRRGIQWLRRHIFNKNPS